MCKINYPRWSSNLKEACPKAFPQQHPKSCLKKCKNYHESLTKIFAGSDPFMSSIFSHLSARSFSTSSILNRMRFVNAWPQASFIVVGSASINHPSSIHPIQERRTAHITITSPPSQSPSKGSKTSGTSFNPHLLAITLQGLAQIFQACLTSYSMTIGSSHWHSEATYLEGIHQVLPMCGLIQGIPDGLKTQLSAADNCCTVGWWKPVNS